MLTETTNTLSVPHIYSESTIGNVLAVKMRQKVGSELIFVTLTNGTSSTGVNINTIGVSPGVYPLVLQSYDTAGGVFSTLRTDTIMINVIDPCTITALVLNSPFVDETYTLSDPQKDITWASDAALGKVAIDPKTCGAFSVSFWLLDGLNNPIQDVKTLSNPLLTIDTASRTFSVLATNGVANVGTYRIAYKVSILNYPTISVA